MKKTYQKPAMALEQFTANEYVSACFDKSKLENQYYFYTDENGDGKCQPSGKHQGGYTGNLNQTDHEYVACSGWMPNLVQAMDGGWFTGFTDERSPVYIVPQSHGALVEGDLYAPFPTGTAKFWQGQWWLDISNRS